MALTFSENMAHPATITKLWDYGWIYHDVVEFRAAPTPGDLVEQYCSSPSFRLSFLPSEKDETGLHGPFVADGIVPRDYVPLPAEDVPGYIKNIEFAHDPDHDTEAHAIILKEMQRTLEPRTDCLALRFTEKSSEHFHGWGSVFFVFREILVPDLERHCLDRFAIGYD